MVFEQDSSVEIPDSFKWASLISLRLPNCGIVSLDRSMHMLPALEYLDVSRNDIAHIVHLQDCSALTSINLSGNRVRVLANIHRVLGCVLEIDLSNNYIESLDGLDKLVVFANISLSATCSYYFIRFPLPP